MNVKKSLVYTFVILLSVLAAVGLAEIYLRLTAEHWSLKKLQNRSMRYESSLYARHVFPRQLQTIVRNKTTHYRINEKGYRGESFSADKPDRQIRIMVYGGSAVFDVHADENKDWPHRMQKLLRSKLDSDRVKVINAGIPGHNALDSFSRYWTEGHRFDPDYVLIYPGWNDLKYFHVREPMLRHFEPRTDPGNVEFDDRRMSPRNQLDAFLGNTSQLYLRLRLQYYRWLNSYGKEGQKPRGQSRDRVTPEATKQFRLTIENFVDQVRNTGGTPILVTQARLLREDLPEDLQDRILYKFINLTPSAALEGYRTIDRILDVVSEQKNAPRITSPQELIGRADYFDDHVHVTEEGSRALAQVITESLLIRIKNRQDLR